MSRLNFNAALSVGLSLLVCSAACAQTHASGVLFGVGVGIGAYDNGPFSDRIASWSPVGSDGREILYRTVKVSQTGTTFNLHGQVLLSPKFSLGISGEMLSFPSFRAVTATEENGEYDLSAMSGAFEFGYHLYNSGPTLLWGFLSAGYGRYNLNFENMTSDSIPLFEGDPIAPGGQADYSGSAARIGVGVGFTHLIGGSENGFQGLLPAVSLRLGWGRFLQHPGWSIDGKQVVNGGNTPCYHGLLLALSIGGGSFSN